MSTAALATPVGPLSEGAFGFLDLFFMITVHVAATHRVGLYVDPIPVVRPHERYATPTPSDRGYSTIIYDDSKEGEQKFDSHVTCPPQFTCASLHALIFMRLLVASALGRLRERS